MYYWMAKIGILVAIVLMDHPWGGEF